MRRVTSLFAIALALAAPWAGATDWQPVASIRTAALSTLPAGSEGEAQVADALRLPKCGGALQVQPTANTTVEVSCPDAGGWRLFVPVKVRRNQTVLVLNRGIGTGETLTAADITTAQRDAARIAGAVLSDPNAAIGRIARRPLQAGALLSNNDLVVQRLIKRGTMWPWFRVAARSRSALPAARWVMPVRMSGSRWRTCPRGGSCRARSTPQVT